MSGRSRWLDGHALGLYKLGMCASCVGAVSEPAEDFFCVRRAQAIVAAVRDVLEFSFVQFTLLDLRCMSGSSFPTLGKKIGGLWGIDMTAALRDVLESSFVQFTPLDLCCMSGSSFPTLEKKIRRGPLGY